MKRSILITFATTLLIVAFLLPISLFTIILLPTNTIEAEIQTETEMQTEVEMQTETETETETEAETELETESFMEETTLPTSEQQNYIGIVNASGLNLRTEPNTNSDIIICLKHKSLVYVTEIIYTLDPDNNIWLKVNYNNSTGYVIQEYVDVFEEKSTDTSAQVGVVTRLGYLHLRTHPNTSSEIIELLHPGDCVDILDSLSTSDEYENWYQICCSNGNIGWVAGPYLQIYELTLVSTAMTQATSFENRNHNIALACSFINGQVITPEKEFSWFEAVGGKCSAEKGFLIATVYQNGELGQDYGGGVCQVATTINMAIMDLGIETISEQHSRPVEYVTNRDYEATVSYPWQNFSFVNTLQNPIMLEVISSNGCCMCNVYTLN